MAQVGYKYINIGAPPPRPCHACHACTSHQGTRARADDCWQVQRFANGTIQPDPVRFPSGMRALSDYVHSAGLKFGVYTARGSGTCQGRPGSLDHETVDAATYCGWELDYLKIGAPRPEAWSLHALHGGAARLALMMRSRSRCADACRGAKDGRTSWSRFHGGFAKCLNETGRYIVQSVESCSDPKGCGTWVGDVANLWRTGGDIQATWSSMLGNIHRNDGMASVATTGHYNDPDMLQVGNAGMTATEQISHFALWCISGAPLLAGTDIVHASRQTLEILTAAELIGVNQDAGKGGDSPQGRRLGGGGWLPAARAAEIDNVLVEACDGSSKQKWTVNTSDDGVTIWQVSSGELLTVKGCARAPLDPFGPGANVTVSPGFITPCNSSNLYWGVHTNGTITTDVDGQCLNVFEGTPGKPYNPGKVQTVSCAKGSKQLNSQWSVPPAGTAGPITSKDHGRCLSTGTAPSPSPPSPPPPGAGSEVWAKPLADGKRVAVLLLNVDDATPARLSVAFSALGLPNTTMAARDLWARKELGDFTGAFTTPSPVEPHGSVMVTLTPKVM